MMAMDVCLSGPHMNSCLVPTSEADRAGRVTTLASCHHDYDTLCTSTSPPHTHVMFKHVIVSAKDSIPSGRSEPDSKQATRQSRRASTAQALAAAFTSPAGPGKGGKEKGQEDA